MSEDNTTTRVGQLRESSAALASYFRRLVTPPVPGDGLLLAGFVEGVIGWGVSWVLATNPGLTPFGPVASIVGLWVVLTAGIVAVGVIYTVPTVRRNRVWMVWGVLNLVATVINLLAVARVLPLEWVQYAYWHPWFAAIGLGYVATAVDDWESPQLRQQERVVYGLSGVITLGLLGLAVVSPAAFSGATVFLIGGAIQLLPIGYDVLADAVLIAPRQ